MSEQTDSQTKDTSPIRETGSDNSDPPQNTGSRSCLSQASRGIMWTTEVTLVVLLLLLTVVALLQITDTTTNEQAEFRSTDELQQLADATIELLQPQTTATDLLLHYNTTAGKFINASTTIDGSPRYLRFSDQPGHPSASVFQYLDSQPVNYQLTVEYSDITTPQPVEFPIVYQGAPSQDRVSTSTTTILEKSDSPKGSSCTLRGIANGSCTGESYLIGPNRPLPSEGDRYNIVTITLTLWKP